MELGSIVWDSENLSIILSISGNPHFFEISNQCTVLCLLFFVEKFMKIFAPEGMKIEGETP